MVELFLFMIGALLCFSLANFILFLFWKLIKIITGETVALDNPISLVLAFFISLLIVCVSSQLYLLISGKTEELNLNLRYLSSLIPHSSSPKFNHNWIAAINLSIKYDLYSFIFLVVFGLIMSCFFYLKIKCIRRRLSNILIFFLLVFWYFYSVPFNIIDNHEQAILNKQLKIDKQPKADLSNELEKQDIEIRPNWFCKKVFSDPDSFPAQSTGECRTTEDFCNKLNKLDPAILTMRLADKRVDCKDW